MRLRKIFERLGERIAVRVVGLQAVRGYVLRRLRLITPDHIYKAIKERIHVWDVATEKDKTRGKFWARKYKKYSRYFTPKLVMDWLREDRPDLASVILNHPVGWAWWEREVEHIRRKLWG